MNRCSTAARVFVIASVVTTAHAQCPDGTPPPCRASAVSVASTRRANPPLNARTWIVVPFGNVMRSPDLDWLRDASVNLLSLDMSRWTDVSVVPDKRVGDLVREVSAGQTANTLTLSDGMAIARRAGAGLLVMGDFFRLGKGARLVANVFDVRSGAKLRSVAQQTTDQDSLLSAFAPLARGVLAVPPPPDARTGDAGTKSLDAYQAYLLGVRALNAFHLQEARKQLTRALSLDSTFALAHMQFALLLAWGGDFGNSTNEAYMHALAAQRLGAALPKRERMIIDATTAYLHNEFSRACDVSRALVAQDSTDIQSLYLVGECSYHDSTVDPSPADATRGAFRSSWNTSLHAFTRILELDPSYLGAFEHVIDILQGFQRGGRTRDTPASLRADSVSWSSVILRSGDSLETVPVRSDNLAAFFVQRSRALKDKTHLANLARAAEIAQRWVNSDTTSEAAHFALARVAIARGDLATADAQLRRTSPRAAPENFQVLRARIEVAAKTGHGAEARAMFDSLTKAIPDAPSILAQRGGIELMFGRLGRLDRGLAAAATPLGPAAVAYERHVGRALLGVPRDEMSLDEAAFFTSMRDSSCLADCRLTRLTPTLAYSLHRPSGDWATPTTLNASNNALLGPVGALVVNDTAKLAASARWLEQSARGNVNTGISEFGWSVIAADGFLAVHDSASALRAARFFVDTAMAFMSVTTTTTIPGVVWVSPSGLLPRTMLMRADLAAASGQRDEARVWYARVLDLWADADAELQPTVTRIRAALAKL